MGRSVASGHLQALGYLLRVYGLVIGNFTIKMTVEGT